MAESKPEQCDLPPMTAEEFWAPILDARVRDSHLRETGEVDDTPSEFEQWVLVDGILVHADPVTLAALTEPTFACDDPVRVIRIAPDH